MWQTAVLVKGKPFFVDIPAIHWHNVYAVMPEASFCCCFSVMSVIIQCALFFFLSTRSVHLLMRTYWHCTIRSGLSLWSSQKCKPTSCVPFLRFIKRDSRDVPPSSSLQLKCWPLLCVILYLSHKRKKHFFSPQLQCEQLSSQYWPTVEIRKTERGIGGFQP